MSKKKTPKSYLVNLTEKDWEAQIPEVFTYKYKGTKSYDIGQGRRVSIPEIKYNNKTRLYPPESVKFDGKEWRPKQMYLNQFKSNIYRPYRDKFKTKNVKDRIKAATKRPSLTFALKPVKLVKPSYGKLPKTVL
tara:strand:- start:64 stop:465 length:402 start_codon:yes stop_codon:yes gene_type:complete